MKLVLRQADPTLKATVVRLATMEVWSPAARAWAASAADAKLTPIYAQDPGLADLGSLHVEGLDAPNVTGDYQFVWRGPDGKAAGDPISLGPAPVAPTVVVVVPGSVVTVG